VAGLLAWSPWSSPKLNPPTGLSVSAAASSAFLHWSAPSGGASPHGYLVLVNGTQVASVPSTADSYQVGSLTPLTWYTFQVASSSGGTSAASARLSVRTLNPPLADGRLYGAWAGQYKITKMQGFDSSANPGVTMTGSWTFTPGCASGACNVVMTGKIGGDPFTSHLTRTGALYIGTATAGHTNCKGSAETDTLNIRVTVSGSGLVGSVWAAEHWTGAMTLVAPATKTCHAGSYQTVFTGTRA
jgi:hypothetical protein